jgi:O-acetyl-ADP-ribose deacetylase (regulator of RNase III)
MIINKEIDLFLQPVDAIIHQTNCHNRMASGVAAGVIARYPEVLEADNATIPGDKSKLGTFLCVKGKNDGKYIYNLYSQYRYGVDRRHTDYEAFYSGLTAILGHMRNLDLKSAAVPYKIASDRGGASWKVILAMLEDVFENSGIDLYICKFKPSNEIKPNYTNVQSLS